MYELKKNGKIFTSKFVGTGPSSYKKRIYRAAVSQRLRNTGILHDEAQRYHHSTVYFHTVTQLHGAHIHVTALSPYNKRSAAQPTLLPVFIKLTTLKQTGQ